MIGIVVDHPSRDLPNLCILSSELIKKNTNVALIPSYKIDHVLLDNPDIFKVIIFNFFRLENLKTILYAKTKNIKVAILDQESIAGIDGLGMTNVFKNKILRKYLKYIDYYFFPSKLIMKECLKYNIENPLNCIITGYQRLDLIKKKIQNIKDKNFVIICTNFPAVNPLFTTKKKIINDEIKYRSNYVLPKALKKNISEVELTFKSFTNEITKVISQFNNINFIIRPHPFENQKHWKVLEKYKNCKVTNEFNSLEWISKCIALIHIDCTTSIEASILNKPSLSLLYANKKNQTKGVFKLAHDCSYLCSSPKQVEKKLKLAIKKKLKTKKPKIIDNFFYSPNELASSIIIKNILNKSNQSKNLKININLNFISYIKYFIEKYLGKKVHNIFLSLYRGKKIEIARKQKEISRSLIKNYINSKVSILEERFFFILKKTK